MSRLVEELLADQQRRWRSGEKQLVEEYLAEHPGLEAQEEGIIDLLYHEFSLRKQHGESPSADEYGARFPRDREQLEAQLTFQHLLCDCAEEAVPAAARARDSRPRVRGYAILGELGCGRYGVVYRALHRGLKRCVALKVLHDHIADDPRAQARFRREAESVARLQHPGIVQVYDVSKSGQRPYLAMELVEGCTLAQVCRGQVLGVGRRRPCLPRWPAPCTTPTARG